MPSDGLQDCAVGLDDDLRRGEVEPVAGHGLHLDVLGAPEPHGDVGIRPDGLDQHAGLVVVGERQLDLAVEHGRLAAGWVAADVERVRGVRDVAHAGEVGGVVQRGGELADPAADGGGQCAFLDDRRRDVPLFLAPGAGELVEAERRTAAARSAPLTFSATTRMFTPDAVANPPVVNSPMTSLMPSACAFSVVSDGCGDRVADRHASRAGERSAAWMAASVAAQSTVRPGTRGIDHRASLTMAMVASAGVAWVASHRRGDRRAQRCGVDGDGEPVGRVRRDRRSRPRWRSPAPRPECRRVQHQRGGQDRGRLGGRGIDLRRPRPGPAAWSPAAPSPSSDPVPPARHASDTADDGLGHLQIATGQRLHRPDRGALDRHRVFQPGQARSAWAMADRAAVSVT